MFILKLEQNLFYECRPEKMEGVQEEKQGDSVFRTLKVDFDTEVETMTVEKRKYPYFFKYYLYWNGDRETVLDFKEEKTIRFILGFYKRYCPEYLKNSEYSGDPEQRLADYFYTEKVPGEAMQHFKAAGEEMDDMESMENSSEIEEPAVSTMEGYHEFNKEEKDDLAGQLDALKSKFADELAQLQELMDKQKGDTK